MSLAILMVHTTILGTKEDRARGRNIAVTIKDMRSTHNELAFFYTAWHRLGKLLIDESGTKKLIFVLEYAQKFLSDLEDGGVKRGVLHGRCSVSHANTWLRGSGRAIWGNSTEVRLMDIGRHSSGEKRCLQLGRAPNVTSTFIWVVLIIHIIFPNCDYRCDNREYWGVWDYNTQSDK
jgi:hypothetical protein